MNRIIKLVGVLLFLCCMLFANFVAVRMILRYGVDIYFYDKLLVAYNIGGPEGLKIELSKIQITDELRREAMLAKDFSTRINTLADPQAFLEEKVRQNKKGVYLIKNLRSLAGILMLILFGWKFAVNYMTRLKAKKTS